MALLKKKVNSFPPPRGPRFIAVAIFLLVIFAAIGVAQAPERPALDQYRAESIVGRLFIQLSLQNDYIDTLQKRISALEAEVAQLKK